MTQAERDKLIRRLERDLAQAQAKSTRAAERRRSLPAGSSRARVTSANAAWMRAAEYRDLCAARLAAAIEADLNAAVRL